MMNIGDIALTIAFALCAFIAVAGALGMATTMSMFRSGIFLMASFIGVAGLFILLAADLMGLLQIMMYIGGMLVMILFMVLFMHDPGGAMMAAMTGMMSPVERIFSGGLQQKKPGGGEEQEDPHAQEKPMHEHGGQPHAKEGAPEQHQNHAQHGGMDHGSMQHGAMQHDQMAHDQKQPDAMDHGGMKHDGMQMGGMDMDMSMVTPVRKLAAWLAAAIGIGLTALVLLRRAWPISAAQPDPHSAQAVGTLLMGKYMVAFEGAGFLILIGIFGAVLLGHVKRHPADDGRDSRVATTDPLEKIEPDGLMPLQPAPAGDAGHEDKPQHHAHGGHA